MLDTSEMKTFKPRLLLFRRPHYCTDIYEPEEEFYLRELLGQRLLCINIGKDDEVVRRYIQQQEAEDRRVDQLKLFE